MRYVYVEYLGDKFLGPVHYGEMGWGSRKGLLLKKEDLLGEFALHESLPRDHTWLRATLDISSDR